VNTRPHLILRTGFFAQDNTLLAVSVEPSRLGSYVAPPDDRVMDFEGQRISDRIDFPDL
jgi:hypothetical protein